MAFKFDDYGVYFDDYDGTFEEYCNDFEDLSSPLSYSSSSSENILFLESDFYNLDAKYEWNPNHRTDSSSSSSSFIISGFKLNDESNVDWNHIKDSLSDFHRKNFKDFMMCDEILPPEEVDNRFTYRITLYPDGKIRILNYGTNQSSSYEWYSPKYV